MIKFVVTTLLLICFSGADTFAQNSLLKEPVVYSSLKAKKYKIIIASNEVLKINSLDSLKNKILYVTGKEGSREISTDIIKRLSVAKPGRQTFKGLGLGLLGGSTIGLIIGRSTYGEPTVPSHYFDKGAYVLTGTTVGCLSGLVVGSIIGAFSHRYKNYDFSEIPLVERRTIITNILTGK